MVEEKPELPISPQEVQIQAPSLLDKIKIHKFKILGGVLGVLVFVGAVFGAYKFAQRQVPLGPAGEPTPTLVATPTPDETTDWETYTNEEYKFSFSYPKNYQLKALSSLEKSFFINEPILLRLELTQDIYQNIGQYPAIVLNVVKTEKTIEQVLDYIKELNKITLEDLKNPESLYYTQSPPKINSVESIKIGNLETTKVERYLGPGGPNPNVLEYYLAFPPYILVFSANFGTYNPDVGQDGTEERETLSRIMTTFKFLEEETPSPTPQLNHVPTLPTTDWKTVSNNGVSFKIPSGAICDNDNLCTKATYTWDYQGHPISSYIYVGVSDYQGESIKERFLEKNTEVVDCRPIYEEVLFGNVKALQIAIENGYCQGSSGGIVAVVGKKLVIIGGGLGYNPETKVIDRWPIRDTIISTLRMQ